MRAMIIFYSYLFGLFISSISRGNETWNRLLPSYQVEDVGPCEFLKEKDYNQDLIKSYPNLNFVIDPQLIQDGKVQFAFETMTAEEFAVKLPFHALSLSPSFEKGMIIAQKAAFLVDKKNKKFYRPEYQLASEVVESIGRKVNVIGKPSIYSTHARKHIKHTLKVIPQIYLDVIFRSYQYNFKKNRFLGDLSEQVPMSQVQEVANIFLNGHSELEPKYLFAVYGDGDQKVLRGIYFLSISYEVPNSDKNLILTWQFSSIRSNIIINTALKLIPGLVKKTVMRDFARYVDAMRTLNPPKGWVLK